jgi:translation initiation factor eIF-2B subunit delta
MEKGPQKSKEEILAERQAKKAAKKQQNKGSVEKSPATPSKSIQSAEKSTSEKISSPAKLTTPVKESSPKTPVVLEKVPTETPDKKSRDEVLAEREAKKLAKLSAKKKGSEGNKKTESVQQPQAKGKEQSEQKREVAKTNSDVDLAVKMENLHISEGAAAKEAKQPQTPQGQDKGKVLSKAERRAIQEAQRAAKAKAQEKVAATPKTPAKLEVKAKEVKSASQTHHPKTPSSGVHKVKQFKHLYTEKCNLNINVNGRLHPAILKLGVQYANDTIVGSNARCYAFLNALKTVCYHKVFRYNYNL